MKWLDRIIQGLISALLLFAILIGSELGVLIFLKIVSALILIGLGFPARKVSVHFFVWSAACCCYLLLFMPLLPIVVLALAFFALFYKEVYEHQRVWQTPISAYRWPLLLVALLIPLGSLIGFMLSAVLRFSITEALVALIVLLVSLLILALVSRVKYKLPALDDNPFK